MELEEAQEQANQWIREVYLPKEYGQRFRAMDLPLQSRGKAKFAAVAEDGEVVAQISTSFAYAPGAKLIKEALLKVQSDALKILWLENTPAKRLMIFIDPDMVRVVKEERRKSHFPKEIELVRVKLPAAIQSGLDNARNTQSPEEVQQ